MLDPRAAARGARAAAADRPATAILHDSADVRLVVFRLAPGQAVPPHRSPATVTLAVLDGAGTLSDGDSERACAAGDVVVFAPDERHGMRAVDVELLLLATITPRPGVR